MKHPKWEQPAHRGCGFGHGHLSLLAARALGELGQQTSASHEDWRREEERKRVYMQAEGDKTGMGVLVEWLIASDTAWKSKKLEPVLAVQNCILNS